MKAGLPCGCGAGSVIPGTAVEIGGFRHQVDECFRCDTYGKRLDLPSSLDPDVLEAWLAS